jgi:hypothetical protein
MGVGGCQECYDDSYKNDSFKTSKYMAGINEYVNESLNEYLKNIREGSQTTIVVENPIESAESNESNECSICYDTMGDKNCCVTECGHKFCLKCLLMAMDRNNTCPMCRYVLKDESRGLGASTANGNRLLNEVDLQGWIDSLPDAGSNLDEDDLDYIISTFGNTDEVIGVLIDNNIIDYDHPLNEEGFH